MADVNKILLQVGTDLFGCALLDLNGKTVVAAKAQASMEGIFLLLYFDAVQLIPHRLQRAFFLHRNALA